MTIEIDAIKAEVLAYEAPFLIEKLLKEQVADSPQEAESLFAEVKKYILLTNSAGDANWEMYSLRVDEVWHQFVLFTHEYTRFGDRFFGRYVHHSPGNAPKLNARHTPSGSFSAFKRRYEEVFGDPISSVWNDENSVTLNRRIVNYNVHKLSVRHRNGTTELLDASGEVLVSVNDLAREALLFISRTGAFYVRELPGGLTENEKVALVATLVKHKLLRLG